LPLPRVEDFSGQRFTGRYAHSNRGKIRAVAWRSVSRKTAAIKSRHREENGRPVARHHLDHMHVRWFRSGFNTVRAPTESGKYIPFPNP